MSAETPELWKESIEVKLEPPDEPADTPLLDEKHRLKRLRALKKLLIKADAFESLKRRYLESLERSNDASGEAAIPPEEQPSEPRPSEGAAQCICELCGQTFGSTKNMLRHMDGYHTIPGVVVRRGGKSLFRCKFCELEFPARNQLLRHCQQGHADSIGRWKKSFKWQEMKQADGPRKLKGCVGCDEMSGSLEELVRHLEKSHAGSFCDICYKVFKDSSVVLLHRRVHLGQNPYACDLCPKVFKSLQHVAEHRQSHTGKRPYQCDECSMGFARVGDLNKHRNLRHAAAPSYLCTECPEAFYSATIFHRHRQKHRMAAEMGIEATRLAVFPCDQCDELFENGNDRKGHVLVRHSEGRPFACDECGKRFKAAGHLKAHKLIHSGVKTQKCDECSASFYLAGDLRRHQKTHRKKEDS